MKKFEAESSVPFSAQANSNTTGTVDTWRDIYLVAGRAGVAVGSSLALVVVLIVNATDAPVTIGGLLQLFLILGLGLSIFFSFAFYTGAVSRFERRTGIDYNNDGRIGDEPITPPTQVIIPVDVYDSTGEKIGQDRPRLDNLSHLEMLAREWGEGNPINQTAGEKLMTRAEYNVLRDQLIDGAFAEWVSRDPKHGWKLTRRGERLFQNVFDRLN